MIPSFVVFHLSGQKLDASEILALEAVSLQGHSADRFIDEYVAQHGLDTDYQVQGDMKAGENLFGIIDISLLSHTVSFFSALRAAEILRRKAEVPFGFDTLMDLHGELFGDVDPYAGMLRTFSEGPYCAPDFIAQEGEAILRRIQADGYLRGKEALLAGYLGDLLALHPFARGSRMAVHLLFEQMGRFASFQIDWRLLERQKLASCEDEAIMHGGHVLSDYLVPAIMSKAHSASTR